METIQFKLNDKAVQYPDEGGYLPHRSPRHP